jgi:multidrug efflux pump subunit AcrA (membrane-fusion protein)
MKRQIIKYRNIIIIAIISLSLGTLAAWRLVLAHGDELNPDEGVPTTTQTLTGVATVGNNDEKLGDLENSGWSGEIVSAGDTSVVPAREGQIASWTVSIGDKVRRGQVLGKLVISSVNPELANLLAERTAAIVIAEAGRQQIINSSTAGRSRLLKLQALIDTSGQSAVASINKDAEKIYVTSQGLEKEIAAVKNSQVAAIASADSELDKAEAKQQLFRQQSMIDADRLMREVATAIGIYGLDDSSATIQTNGLSFFYGVADSNGRNQYLDKLNILFQALKKKSNGIPETATIDYAKAAHRLLSTTIVHVDLNSEKLASLQTLLSEGEDRFLASLQNYKLAVKDLEVKKSEKEKVINDFDSQLAVLQSRLSGAQVDMAAIDIQKNKHFADISLEIGRQKNDLESKIADFDNEVASTKAEVAAAQSAYRVVANIGTGEQIIALSDGIISAIHKNVGDHVSPETIIADISSVKTQPIIRFHLPYNSGLPQVGDTAKVELLGFPFEQRDVIITGIGSALDDQGFLTAEAKFKETVAWPTHSQVKIYSLNNSLKSFVPLSAVWWNEQKQPAVWLVMENNIIRQQTVTVGRTLGNQVEIIDGLIKGQRYIISASSDLKTGQIIAK